MLKKCVICHEEKDIDEGFYWSRGKSMCRCKECHKECVKIWRKHHKEEILKHRERFKTKRQMRATNNKT